MRKDNIKQYMLMKVKKKSYYTEHLENEMSRGVGKTSVLIKKKS